MEKNLKKCRHQHCYTDKLFNEKILTRHEKSDHKNVCSKECSICYKEIKEQNIGTPSLEEVQKIATPSLEEVQKRLDSLVEEYNQYKLNSVIAYNNLLQELKNQENENEELLLSKTYYELENEELRKKTIKNPSIQFKHEYKITLTPDKKEGTNYYNLNFPEHLPDNDQAPFFIGDVRNIVAFINTFAKCSFCNNELYVKTTDIKNGSTRFILECYNIYCKKIINFEMSRRLNNAQLQYEIPNRFAESWCLCSSDYIQYETFCNLFGIPSFSGVTFGKIKNNILKKTTSLLEDKLQHRRDEIKNKHFNSFKNVISTTIPLNIILDCRWSSPRGYSAEESSITIIDADTGKTIYIKHVMRTLSRPFTERTYIGSSKAMEGYAVEQLMHDIKKDGFFVESFVHDADASTSKHIHDVFPLAIEERCIGHGAKNFRSKILELGRTYKHLNGYGDSAFRWFLVAAKMVKEKTLCRADAVSEFTKLMFNFVNHCQNDHTNCIHDIKLKKSKKNPIPPDEYETISRLFDVIMHITQQAETYIMGKSANAVESINNSISVTASKHKHYNKNYAHRSNMGIMNHEQGNMYAYKYDIINFNIIKVETRYIKLYLQIFRK